MMNHVFVCENPYEWKNLDTVWTTVFLLGFFFYSLRVYMAHSIERQIYLDGVFRLTHKGISLGEQPEKNLYPRQFLSFFLNKD